MSCKWLGYLISGWVFCVYFFCDPFVCCNGGVSHSIGCYHSSVLCICVWHLLGIRVTTNLQAKCNDCGEFPMFYFIYQVWYLQSYVFSLYDVGCTWEQRHGRINSNALEIPTAFWSMGWLQHDRLWRHSIPRPSRLLHFQVTINDSSSR